MNRLAGILVLSLIGIIGVHSKSFGTCEQPKCSFNGELLPVVTNCSQFYLCGDSSANLRSCQSGLHFNPNEGICDWPINVGCVPCDTTTVAPTTQETTTESTTTEATTTEEVTTEEITTEEVTTEKVTTEEVTTEEITTEEVTTEEITTEEVTTEEITTEEVTTEEITTENSTTEGSTTTESSCEISDCPETNGFTLLKVPFDCSSFVVCLNGEAISRVPCNAGYLFDANLGHCVSSELVECEECEQVTTTLPETTTEEVEVETETPEPNSTCETPQCPLGAGLVVLAIPHDCSQFLFCTQGAEPQIMTCREGWEFNANQRVCTPAENSECVACQKETTTEQEVESTTSSENTPTEEDVESTTEEIEESTTTGEETTEADTESTTTEEETTEEASTTSEVTTEAATTTVSPKDCVLSSCAIWSFRTLSAVPWNCNQYAVCTFGSITIENCANNFYFDSNSKTCVSENLNCVACVPSVE